jgi:hypothetical protein
MSFVVRCVTMPSTVIRRFAYDEMTGDLWVEFTTGRRYVYADVPIEVADAFRGAFAKGVYFNTRIKDQFSFRDVTHEDEATKS